MRLQSREISQDIKQQAGRISILHERNKQTRRLLREETEHINASILRLNSTDAGESNLVNYAGFLKSTEEKYMGLREDMRHQEDVIIRIAKFWEDSSKRFDENTTQALSVIEQQAQRIRALESENADHIRTICDLGCKKSALEYNCQEQTRLTVEQTRIAASMESKLTKTKEVINNSAHMLLLELDYEDELINDLPEDPQFSKEFFKPNHKTMTDLAENIEQWTSDDSETEMTFDLELEPDLKRKITVLEDKLELKAMQLDYQNRKIAEQKKIIGELEVQNRKLGQNLEESELEVVNLLDKQCPPEHSTGTASPMSGETVTATLRM